MIDPRLAIVFPLLLPIGTTAPRDRPAYATYGLFIAINLIYLVSLFAPETMVNTFALHPGGPFYQYLTYAFLHQGLVHLASNLYFFWIFSVGLESRIGSSRLLALWAIAAVAGGLAHRWTHISPEADVLPLVGSSGAVFGVIGAYILIFPYTAVRTLFCVLLLVIPVFTRVYKIHAIVFLPLFWLLQLFVNYILTNLFALDSGVVSTASHLGGLAAGMALATSVYGLGAFAQAPVAPPGDSDLFLKQLNRDIKRAAAGLSPVAPADAPDNGPGAAPFRLPERLPTRPPRAKSDAAGEKESAIDLHHPIVQIVQKGNADLARDVYGELLTYQPHACLQPDLQLELGRLLIQVGAHKLAIRALETLLRFHRNEDAGRTACLELGALLVNLDRSPNRAAELLTQFLDSQPAIDEEREARALLAALPESVVAGVSHAAAGGFVPAPENIDFPDGYASAMDAPTRARLDLDEIFGDPENSQNMAPPQTWEGPPPKEKRPAVVEPAGGDTPINIDQPPVVENPEADARSFDNDLLEVVEGVWSEVRDTPEDRPEPDPEDETSCFKIKLDDSEWMRLEGIHAPPSDTGTPPPSKVQPSQKSHPIDPDAPEANDAPVAGLVAGTIGRVSDAPRDADPEHLDPADVSPPAPDETSPNAFQTGVMPTRKNHERADILRGPEIVELTGGRLYTLILAPGRPVDIPSLIAVLTPVMRLSLDGVHHAVLRRRGILATDLTAEQIRHLALRLDHRGQAVAAVPQNEGGRFGEALDVAQLVDHGRRFRIGHETGVEERDWRDIVCLGGGWVGLSPGAPCRAVLDLFLRNPNRHLRLWEATFTYPPDLSAGNRHQRFLGLTRKLVQRTGHAIHTRTLTTWLEEEPEQETTQFCSLIEYDNYLFWHLLAYCLPSLRFDSHAPEAAASGETSPKSA